MLTFALALGLLAGLFVWQGRRARARSALPLGSLVAQAAAKPATDPTEGLLEQTGRRVRRGCPRAPGQRFRAPTRSRVGRPH
jgi:hypothetical protein